MFEQFMHVSEPQLIEYFGGPPDFIMIEDALKEEGSQYELRSDSSEVQTDQILNTLPDNLLITQEKRQEFDMNATVSVRESLISQNEFEINLTQKIKIEDNDISKAEEELEKVLN